MVRAIGQALGDGGMSGVDIVASAHPAPYAILALDSDWVPAIRGQVSARARLRELAAKQLGTDVAAWSVIAARVGAGFRGTISQLLASSTKEPGQPREEAWYVARVLHGLFRILGMRVAEEYLWQLESDCDETRALLSGQLSRELREAIIGHRPSVREPRFAWRDWHDKIGDVDKLLEEPFPESLLADLHRAATFSGPHVQALRVVAETLQTRLGANIEAWAVAMNLADDGFAGDVEAFANTASALAS